MERFRRLFDSVRIPQTLTELGKETEADEEVKRKPVLRKQTQENKKN